MNYKRVLWIWRRLNVIGMLDYEVALLRDWRDLWIGVYWTIDRETYAIIGMHNYSRPLLVVYVALLPFFPIRFKVHI